MPKSKSSPAKTDLQFFFPSIVAGVVAWLFSSDFMLGVQVFIVVVLIQFAARWVYKR